MAAEEGVQLGPVSRVMAKHVYICIHHIHSPAVLSLFQLVTAVLVQNAQDGVMPRRCHI